MTSLTLLTCSVNAKSSDRPKWVDDPKSEYPDGIYLSVVGEGDSRRQAEQNAAAKLSRIFESKIEVEQSVQEKYTELTENNEAKTSSETNIANQVNIASNQTLFNIKFDKYYTDKYGRVSVLAYIHRHNTAEIYESKIQDNIEKINFYEKQAVKADDLLKKFAYLDAAYIFHKNVQLLLEQMDIIQSSYKELLDINYDKSQLMNKYLSVSEKVTFSINVENDSNGKLYSIIEQALTDYGFSIVKTDPLIKVSSVVSLKKIKLPRKEKFIRWTLDIKIIKNRETFISIYEKGREGHLNYSEAEARAYRSMEDFVNGELEREINNHLKNMVMDN